MSLGKKVAAAALAMGLTVGAGMASRAMAQDGQLQTLAELNRAISAENLDPSMQTRTKRFDKDGDGHKETVGKLYFTKDGGRIAVSSYNGTLYAFGVDSDRRRPFDYAGIDSNCDGSFEELGPEEAYYLPSCLKK